MRSTLITPAPITRGMQHPAMRPAFRCRPDRDKGTPICRDSLAWAWEMPRARRHENDRPGMPVRLLMARVYLQT